MTITTSYYDSLVMSSSDTSVNVTTDAESTALSSDDFLTLLVTELEYQDPTEPMDNTEMVNQLTQYSQLDELSAMNEKMDELTAALNSMSSANGLDYLGKQVEADGATITKSDDEVSPLYFELSDYAESVTCNIYDSNGSIVDTEIYTQLDAGTSAFVWDGTDYNGNTVANGQYTVLITAQDSDGAEVETSTTTTGTVTGVATTDEGVILTLDDGRTVNMVDVTYATT